MSDAELDAYLDTVAEGTIFRQTAFEEFTRRRMRSMARGHGTLTPTFWVIVATLRNRRSSEFIYRIRKGHAVTGYVAEYIAGRNCADDSFLI